MAEIYGRNTQIDVLDDEVLIESQFTVQLDGLHKNLYFRAIKLVETLATCLIAPPKRVC